MASKNPNLFSYSRARLQEMVQMRMYSLQQWRSLSLRSYSDCSSAFVSSRGAIWYSRGQENASWSNVNGTLLVITSVQIIIRFPSNMKWQHSIQARPSNKRLPPEDQSFTAFQATQKRNSNSLLVLSSVRVREPSLHRSTARSNNKNQTYANQSQEVNTGQGKTEEEGSERRQQTQEDIRNTTKLRYLQQLNLHQSNPLKEHLPSQIEQLKNAIDVAVLAFKQKCNYQALETEIINEVSGMIGTHVIESLRDGLPSPTLDKIMKKISEKVDLSPKITEKEENKAGRVLSYKQSKIEERERLNNIKKSYDKIRLILSDENNVKVGVKEKKLFRRTNGPRKQKATLPRRSEESEISQKLSSSSQSRVYVRIQKSFYEISKVLHSVSGNS